MHTTHSIDALQAAALRRFVAHDGHLVYGEPPRFSRTGNQVFLLDLQAWAANEHVGCCAGSALDAPHQIAAGGVTSRLQGDSRCPHHYLSTSVRRP